MFLKFIFIYFLLLCKVLNTKFCLSKFATKLMFHWKAIIILPLLYRCSLLFFHGHIESNPGLKYRKNHLPLFYHCYLNSLVVTLKSYNAIYKYNFVYLFETSSILSDHISLNLEGYNLIRTDYPNN